MHSARPAGQPPIPLEEAIRLLEEDGRRYFGRNASAVEAVALSDASGRILAHDLTALSDHPNVDDSSLDGIACREADTRDATSDAPTLLRLIGESVAGRPFDGTVGPGEAVRIQTGAALPAGADAIVPVERLSERDGQVGVHEPARRGAIRPRGQDVRTGDVGLAAGRRLDAAAIAFAAAMGHPELLVRTRLRVAILTSGDELVRPGGRLQPGQVYDANLPALETLVTAAGAGPLVLPPIGDEPNALDSALRKAPPFDLLLSCGGISMGRHDHVRDMLLSEGELIFRKVRLKPGGPTTFAHLGGRPWLALPGNPVSATVTFLILARAWLDRAIGRSGPLPFAQRAPARAAAPMRAAGAKTTLLRVSTSWQDESLLASPAFDQTSSVLRTLASADALAVLPEHAELAIGDRLDVISLGPHLG